MRKFILGSRFDLQDLGILSGIYEVIAVEVIKKPFEVYILESQKTGGIIRMSQFYLNNKKLI